MADEPVVVSKTRPVKASNGVEGKTELIVSTVWRGCLLSKAQSVAKGGSTLEDGKAQCFFFSSVHKLSDEIRHLELVAWKQDD